MIKAEFLKDLDRRLQILKQQEREDILGEYAQHIELKMENGLSEEEAIRDFGDLEELADEILDAYNVNPLYGKEEKGGFLAKAKMEELGGKAGAVGRRAGSGLKAVGGGIVNGLKAGGRTVKRLVLGGLSAIRRGCLRLGQWWKTSEEKAKEERENKDKKPGFFALFHRETVDGTEVRERSGRDMWAGICSAVGKLGRGLGRLMCLCFRLGVIVFVVAPAAFGDCLALVGLGVLIVMVALGYPLIGITVMTLGALACGVSFVLLIWNLMYGKKPAAEVVMNPVTDTILDTMREEEEVQIWESEER